MITSEDLSPQGRLRLIRFGFAFTPGGTFVAREEVAAGDAARRAGAGARRERLATGPEAERVREQLVATGLYNL